MQYFLIWKSQSNERLRIQWFFEIAAGNCNQFEQRKNQGNDIGTRFLMNTYQLRTANVLHEVPILQLITIFYRYSISFDIYGILVFISGNFKIVPAIMTQIEIFVNPVTGIGERKYLVIFTFFYQTPLLGWQGKVATLSPGRAILNIVLYRKTLPPLD